MKKLIRLFVFAALVATLALPALAQTPAATPTSTPAAAAPAQDDAEAKTLLYNKFRDNLKANPQAAYEAGKEYLAKYEAKDGPEDQYVKYIKKWVDSYDKIARRNQVLDHIKNKNYNDAFTISRQVLTDFPDDLGLLYELSKAGLFAATSGNEANNADAANYAKRTIQMIQSGKTFEKDKPIPNKDEIVGGLNYALGIFSRKSQPGEAANYFINAAQFEGFAKKDPQTYSLLAASYEEAEYAKLRNEYEANCKTEEQLKAAQCTELTAKVNNVLDRMIDALARAIAYSKASPDAAKYEQARTAWMEQLTALYKYRNNGADTGLNELITGVTSKPIPRASQTTSPATPQTTPASNTTTPTQPGGTAGTSTTTPAGANTSSTKPTP